jgi:hypothetical protein
MRPENIAQMMHDPGNREPREPGRVLKELAEAAVAFTDADGGFAS